MIFSDTPHFLFNSTIETVQRSRRIAAHTVEHEVANEVAHTVAQRIAVCAVRSLYEELVLYPKPGLVSLRDNGSHSDMNAVTLMRSLFSLRHYFKSIALAGWRTATFVELKQLGQQAEQKMLIATNGVNTHRGAIFVLGMLCAAAGAAARQHGALSAPRLRATLQQHWGAALLQHAGQVDLHNTPHCRPSHGQQAAQLFAVSGAREEGALGFPTVFEIGVPRWIDTWNATADAHRAQIDCLFALMARMSDTNLYHRGGIAGATWAKAHAQTFLDEGGSAAPAWMEKAEQLHHAFVTRRLSPGGAADLLAASRFIVILSSL